MYYQGRNVVHNHLYLLHNSSYLWIDNSKYDLIREHIDRHQDMGTYLGSYAMDVAKGWKPNYLPGRKKAEFSLRNIVIALLVLQVVRQFGVKAFRNETSSSKPCGCSVVARVWREERHDDTMTEATVVTIVTTIKRAFPHLNPIT